MMSLALSLTSPSTLTFTSKTLTFNSLKSSFNGVRIPQLRPTLFFTTRPSYSSSLVKMAKREEELKEIRTKTTEELNEEIVDLKGELFMLRLQRSARNEFTSSEFRRMHRRGQFELKYSAQRFDENISCNKM